MKKSLLTLAMVVGVTVAIAMLAGCAGQAKTQQGISILSQDEIQRLDELNRKQAEIDRQMADLWNRIEGNPGAFSGDGSFDPEGRYDTLLSTEIVFAKSKWELSPSDKGSLDEFVDALAKNMNSRIEIRGFADQSGNPTFNAQISESRANMARDYFTDKFHIPYHRIYARGMGAIGMPSEDCPRCRRVEVILIRPSSPSTPVF